MRCGSWDLLRSALGGLELFSVSNEEISPARKLIVAFPFELCRIAIMWSRKTRMQKESESKIHQNEENSVPSRSVSTCLNTTLFLMGFDNSAEFRLASLFGFWLINLFDLKYFIQGLLISLNVPGSSQKFLVGNKVIMRNVRISFYKATTF